MGTNSLQLNGREAIQILDASGAKPPKEAHGKYLRFNIVARVPDNRRLTSSSGSRNAGRDLAGGQIGN